MNIFVPKLYWRILNTVFFGFMLFSASQQAFLQAAARNIDPWFIGDWLINYQGGVVRRGLVGEIFFQVSQRLGVDIILLVIVIQLLVYLIFLINTYRLVLNSPFSAWNAALIFSPAFMLFPNYNVESGFRKEILLFALLSILCVRFALSSRGIPKMMPVYIGAVGAFIVLSHEMLAVFLPYIVCAFLIHEGGLGIQTKRIVAATAAVAAIAVLIIVFGQGNQKTVIDICNSLQANAPSDCRSYPERITGAITFFGGSLKLARIFVEKAVGAETLAVYALTGILSFLPLAVLISSGQFKGILPNKQSKIWLAVFAGIALTGTLPLLWIVADYGRLINIHVTCLSLLWLTAMQVPHETGIRLDAKQAGAWLLALLFAISWRLIYWHALFETAFPVTVIVNPLFIRLKRFLRPLKYLFE